MLLIAVHCLKKTSNIGPVAQEEIELQCECFFHFTNAWFTCKQLTLSEPMEFLKNGVFHSKCVARKSQNDEIHIID